MGPRPGWRSSPKFDVCLGYIHANYARSTSISKLATRARISPSYMFRTFKRGTGFTPVQYRNLLRIEEARRLLRNRALSVEEVARQVGFDDPRYFSRVFKKESGLSPREFRKQLGGRIEGER